MEHQFSRQATKTDLIDIARALGLPGAAERHTVPELRAVIRAQLQLRPEEQRVVAAVLAWILPRTTSDDACMQAILDAGNDLLRARRAALAQATEDHLKARK